MAIKSLTSNDLGGGGKNNGVSTSSSSYNSSNQPVDQSYLYKSNTEKVFSMIDNYVYLYHTDTLVAVPTFPETIADSMAINYSQTAVLSRSAPIFSYVNSGPRSFTITLNLHRDMMNSVNFASSNLQIAELGDYDYVDLLVNQLRAAALPRYAASEKMVDPPIVAVRFGNDIFCKGVITGGVTTTYSGPILRTDKYALVTVDFTINEIDPYDAASVVSSGGFRGISSDLERRIWKTNSSGAKGAIKG